ncbi:DUF6918 family protein [Chondromyces crocatus]|uniref:Uncharacterized protein n=1 Tax=Chondromyces crocatus TaxID=52 RepID=A0A0K1EB32_CHOCO|nr:hypothetical protein [Chondromyces crocatus]AKT38081.1 uncharacterized protein CMC5_022230 [Chondromyces crocatus]
MSLSEKLTDPSKKAQVIDDCCRLIDQEVGDKGGLSGFAVKAAYSAVKGVKPGFVAHVVERLLPEFVGKLDPIWLEGVEKGKPADHLTANRSRVADALLSVTDAKARNSSNGVVRGAYDKLRGSAKKHVEDAVPRLSQLLQKHAG